MMLGWKDRKTGKLYDLIEEVFYDLDTGDLVSVLKCQATGRKCVVQDKYELVEVEGEMVPRFCRWYIATEHMDNGF